MPLCITCTNFVPYLYTVYESKHNLRLEQCGKCHQFADPYVEHDSLTLVLDLFLFKRGVYRHLLYNRGTKPRHAKGDGKRSKSSLRGSLPENAYTMWWVHWLPIIRLGALLVFVDAFIRWSYFYPNHSAHVTPWTTETLLSFFRVLVGCVSETIAFHSGIIAACFFSSGLVRYFRMRRFATESQPSAIRNEFRYSLIPMALFYSSLIKLFLLFLLTIWRPAPTSSTSPPRSASHWDNNPLSIMLEFMERENINREWVIRNALGGMSAGFGLRVILDYHPGITTMVILTGWLAKTGANRLLGQWVGEDESVGSAWQTYSIP